MEYNHYHIPAFFNIGCGIPAKCYTRFMAEFDRLDQSDPYDNGLTFKDVTKVEYETSRKGSAIQFRLVNQAGDGPYQIVGFITVESHNSKLDIIKGWEMTPPFEVG